METAVRVSLAGCQGAKAAGWVGPQPSFSQTPRAQGLLSSGSLLSQDELATNNLEAEIIKKQMKINLQVSSFLFPDGPRFLARSFSR